MKTVCLIAGVAFAYLLLSAAGLPDPSINWVVYDPMQAWALSALQWLQDHRLLRADEIQVLKSYNADFWMVVVGLGLVFGLVLQILRLIVRQASKPRLPDFNPGGTDHYGPQGHGIYHGLVRNVGNKRS